MKGLTLIEMVIALSLAVIVCVIAIPSFFHSDLETQGEIAQAQLLTQLQQAQSLANQKMTGVTICLGRDGVNCVSDRATMILTLVGDELMSSAYVKGRGTLHLRSYPSYRDSIAILPAIIGKSDNGTFWYCSKDNALQWAVTVNQSGEPQVLLAKDGVIDGLPGDPLVC